jgi:thymidylate synthase
MLKIRDDKLHWTQIMRSNDLFRGTPYNFVQFSVLQEVLSGWLGVKLGTYTHLSDSLHVYERDMRSLASFVALDAPVSEDTLLLPKSKSDVVWAELNRCVVELSVPGLREENIAEVSTQLDNPAGRNMLLIIAADSARRRAYYELANELASRCTNPLLAIAWQRWSLRTRRSQSSPQ